MHHLYQKFVVVFVLFPLFCFADFPYSKEELAGKTFYDVFLYSGCGPEWVLEPLNFTEGGKYTISICSGEGGGKENGSYKVTKNGVLRLVYPGGRDFIRRVHFDESINGWQTCWASSEGKTLKCSEEELSRSYTFDDFSSAEAFWLQQKK